LKINTEIFHISTQMWASKNKLLKRNWQTTLESRRYNPSVQNYQWERSPRGLQYERFFVLAPNKTTRGHKYT